ncbi:MAG: DNA polymerase III subunit delta' [Gammaproteobacteria bacterium]
MSALNSAIIQLPWHQPVWQQFAAYQQQQRLPHALLLSGMPGLAKKTFAEQIARTLLCEKAASDRYEQACGACYSCQLTAINEHPDYFEIVPLEESKAIKIEQIRELIELLQQTSHRLGRRVIVISPAEAMNHAAANALLKTLEEPGAGCHFLLVSHAAAQLSATICSRCQSLRFYPSFSTSTLQWLMHETQQDITAATMLLKQAEGAPQRAVELAKADMHQMRAQLIDDLKVLASDHSRLISIAQQWQKHGLPILLDELIFVLNQSITMRLMPSSQDPAALLIFTPIPINNLINYTQYIMQVKKELIVHPNLNAQLLSETVLLQWLKANRPL